MGSKRLGGMAIALGLCLAGSASQAAGPPGDAVVRERSASAAQSAEALLERGLIAARAGQYPQAISLLSQTLSVRPGNSVAILALMALHAAREDYASALAVPIGAMDAKEPGAQKIWVAKVWLVETLQGGESALSFLRALPPEALTSQALKSYEFSLLMRVAKISEAGDFAQAQLAQAGLDAPRVQRWTMASLSALLMLGDWSSSERLARSAPSEAFGGERERARVLRIISQANRGAARVPAMKVTVGPLVAMPVPAQVD